MASVTYGRPFPDNLWLPDLLQHDADNPDLVIEQGATSVALSVPSFAGALFIEVTGIDFDYVPATEGGRHPLPIGGTVTGMTVTLNGDLLISFADLSLDLQDVDHFMFGWVSRGTPRPGNGFDLISLMLSGNDVILGSDGDDDLMPGRNAGNDHILAGAGSDFIKADAGNDTIDGGADRDTYSLMESFYDATAFRGAVVNLSTGQATDSWGGSDTLVSFERVEGSRLADQITGSAADERFNGLKGRDTIDGGGGRDLVRYDRDADFGGIRGVTVNLATGVARDGWGALDTLRNIEDVRATNGNDTLTGNSADNWFHGRGGVDSIDGGNGRDGVDFWADFVTSGAVVDLSLASGQVTNDGFGNVETLVSIEELYGTFLADRLTGGTAANWLGGDAGNDTLSGGGGKDTLTGGSGIDVLNGGTNSDMADFSDPDVAFGAVVSLSRSTAQVTNDGFGNVETLVSIEDLYGTFRNDSLTGSSGANDIAGDEGNDTLSGGAGNDTLRGGGGVDRLTGGTGTDVFVFDRSGAQAPWGDRVVDFVSGTDRLAFSTTDFVGMDAVLRFQNGTSAGSAGESWFYFDDATDRLFWDADGIGGAQAVLAVTLTGVTSLTGADFELWT